MATGVEVRVAGQVIKGVTGYSAQEESTPIDPSDTTGATGTFSVDFPALRASEVKRMRRQTIDLEDLGQGTTQGVARVPNGGNGVVSLTADSRLSLMAVTRTALPYSGTLGGYFTYLLGLVGITSGYVIDTALAAQTITLPGWRNDVWLMAKGLAASRRAEISLVSDNIVFRPVRGRVTVDRRDLDYTWAVDDNNLAQAVAGYYYQSRLVTNELVYPKGGWNEDVQIYQVDAREIAEYDIPLEASLTSIQQPVVQDYVAREYTSASVYCVVGNDGLPIKAAQWTAAGGSLTVAIGEDTRSITVTIRGADLDQYAPFRIAAASGTSDNYSSLRLIGSGVFFDKKLETFATGVSPDIASQEVGVTVDNPAISTLAELRDSMVWALKRYGTSHQTISVTTTGINRADETGSYAYPTIAEFNARMDAAGVQTVAQFNARYAGMTVDDFNAEQLATVATLFVNQAFGNVAGARTLRDDLWWRIRRATLSPASISYDAEEDTTIADLNAVWSGGYAWSLDFENGEGALDGYSPGSSAFANDKTISHSGTASLKHIGGALNQSLLVPHAYTPDDRARTMSGWVRVEAGAQGGLALYNPTKFGYQCVINPANGTGTSASFSLRRQTTTVLAESPALGIVAGAWYRIEIDYKATGNRLTGRLYNAAGALLSTLTSSDATYGPALYFAVYGNGVAYYDDLQATDYSVNLSDMKREWATKTIADFQVAKLQRTTV